MNNFLIANYIKSAWRNILRHKLFSIINILGLAIGLAAVMLIALYVRYETSYDSFWKNADNIYRVHMHMDVPGKDPEDFTAVPFKLAPAMKENFPEIDQVTRVANVRMNVTYDNEPYIFQGLITDPNILDMFDFKIVYGDLSKALNDTSSIILNKTQSQKIFGNINPVGETISLQYVNISKDFKVSAVIDDTGENSFLRDNNIIALAYDEYTGRWLNNLDGWYLNTTFLFMTFKNGKDIRDISKRFPDFINQTFPPLSFGDANAKPSSAVSFSLMKLRDLYLNTPGNFDLVQKGNKTSVIFFTVIAMLILIIAGINFMNLSTARASQRATEVNMRKVVGAKRKNLIIQFLGESIFITILSFILSLAMIELLLPFYNNFLGRDLTFSYFSKEMIVIFLFTILVGITGGLYPAMVLTGFRPAHVLRANKSKDTKHTTRFRTILVVFQFTISIFLFVSTAVIYNQLKLFSETDLGYVKENLVTIRGNDVSKIAEKIELIKEQFLQIPDVRSVTTTSNFWPGLEFVAMDPIRPENETEPIMMNFRGVGYDFLETFGIPLIIGRDYDIDRRDERPSRDELRQGVRYTASLIINKSAVRRLGFESPEDAIGKLIFMNVGLVGENGGQEQLETGFEVIGVTEDVHFTNIKTEAQPEFYQLKATQPFFITLRYDKNPINIVNEARKIWAEQLPSVTFIHHYASETVAEQYAEEQTQMTMFAAFSGLAIFIACLGLFGLASFTAERRTKEIGIRKVFGAEVWQIVKMLVFQFSKPVLIANIIAWPIAYLAMSRWLESFVYRIDDMVIIALCLVAGLTALLIAWATVAGNSYAVARQNPIKALRYE